MPRLHCLFSLAGFTSASLLLAQGPYAGAKIGLNVSSLYDTKVDNSDSRLGFNGGLFARSTIDGTTGVQVELLYSTKGTTAHYEGVFGLVDQDVDFRLNYLEFPLLFAVRFAHNAVELQAGGYGAFLLNANVSSSGDLGSGSEELDRDHFNSVDAGLVGGAAFNVGPIQAGFRYLYGLTTLANSDEAEELLGDSKNGCAQVYIAFGGQ